MRRVAHDLADVLAAAGVRQTFQVTGGDQSLWIALRDAGIRMVLARSEQGATYMADGYARASGRVGITYGQHGPGAANVAASLADAWWASSPVVALTSGIATGSRGRLAYQEIDQAALFRPVTRWSTSVANPQRAAQSVRSAIEIACAHPSGPAHVDLPRDVIEATVDEPAAAARERALPDVYRPVPDPRALDEAAAIVRGARRPLILAGAGAISADAAGAIAALSAELGIPVASTPGGKGIVDEEGALAVGQIGRYAGRAPNEIAGEADVVLVLGSALGLLATRDGSVPSRAATIVHVDLDPSVFGRTYRPRLAIVADVRATAEALLAGVPELRGDWSAWTSSTASRIAEWRERCRQRTGREEGGLHPVDVFAELASVLEPTDIVVADTGYMAAWAGVLVRVRTPGRSFFRAAGSLGWAIPGAIGVALGSRGRRVVCISGDGGAGYNLLELETAVRLGVPVTVLVLDNRSLAFEYHEQRYNWNGNVVPEANDFGPIDFAAVAGALGAHGEGVASLPALGGAVRAAADRAGPTLVHVPIDKEAVAPVANYDRVLARDI